MLLLIIYYLSVAVIPGAFLSAFKLMSKDFILLVSLNLGACFFCLSSFWFESTDFAASFSFSFVSRDELPEEDVESSIFLTAFS
jgi:hypothetical protein